MLISREEFDALHETAELLRSPVNAERLQQALADAREGRTEPHDLW